ncbi:MAG: inorganic diphosphatase [Candidatus Staskawiczbacteria bacterium]|nr:inorganic diphosphatase [Candidatus Staskawiczbacteria bacterium]
MKVFGNKKMEKVSLEMARQFLGKTVRVEIDRPVGSKHPQHKFVYTVNYGYINGTKAPDGEELDAYYLGTDKPLQTAEGIVKAVIHRLDNDDDKLIVMPKETDLSDAEIEAEVAFQEKWFKHIIIRK